MKTPTTHHFSRKPEKGGSTIFVVIILCTAVLIVVGAYLNALSVQSRISNSLVAQNQARNAAEGVAELAVAEMNRRSNSNPSFGASANPNPLSGYSLATADINSLAPGTGNNHVIASSIGFKNSTLSSSPSAPMPINGADPINATDPMKDTTPVSIRAMTIYATASVPDPVTNNPITSYISETVYVRDQTWFNYAMFYNMDIEFHAGPNFDIYGPVFTNASAFVTEGNGNELNFHSSLCAVGKMYRFDKYFGITNTNNSSSTHAGYVKILNKAGTAQTEMVSGINVTNGDSTDTSFYAHASATWGTHAEDSTFGVKLFNPPGMRAYVPEDFTTAATEMRNSGYLIIEPQLAKKPTDTDYAGINNFGFKPTTDTSSPVDPNASENLKISALSGFVIQVKPAAVGVQPQWRLICYKATDSSHLISADNPPLRDTDDSSGTTGLPEIACIIDPFNDKDDVDYPAPSTQATIKRTLKIALLNAIVSIPYRDVGTTAAVWGNGNSALTAFDPSIVPPASTSINGTAAFKSALLSSNNGLPTSLLPAVDAHYPLWNGYYPIYDQREGHDYTTAGGETWNSYKGAYNVLRIDLGKLNTLLNDATGKWQAPYGSAAYVYNPATSYTGAVYVQFPIAAPDAAIKSRFPTGDAFGGTAAADATVTTAGITSASPVNGDRIRPAEGPDATVVAVTHPNTTAGYALLLENAGTLPQMVGGTPDGFTIATNGPLYIHGNYNADGNSATGSSTLPDSAAEVPAMIAADAVTVLSADSLTGATYNLFNFPAMATTRAPSANNFTEISAAILTGIVPTHPNTDNIWSGGVHNLIRYLESWDVTYRFRGSLGVIYQSEVAKSAYHEGFNGFYSPPTRDMGYHQYFSQGRFPPATPIKRTVRRMNLQDIVRDPVTGNTPAQIYTAGPTTPPAFN